MYADDPTSLFDSTQKLLLFCKSIWLVNWLSTGHISRPVIWTCSRVEQGGWLWNGSISHTSLEKSFPFNVCFFQCRGSGSSGVKWSRKLFYENFQIDGLGECSILDRTAIPHSHHSRRLFWPQLSLKKASREKDPTGLHCHALLPTTYIITLCSGRSMNPEARYADMRQLCSWQANDFLIHCELMHWTLTSRGNFCLLNLQRTTYSNW